MTDKPVKMSHYQMAQVNEQKQKVRQEKYKDKSRQRLIAIISKKITTTFIGNVAAVEEEFGFLWGHNKMEEDRTDEENSMAELWERLRVRMLDNGNQQLRGAQNELNSNTISWDRYKMELPVKPIKEENTDEESDS